MSCDRFEALLCRDDLTTQETADLGGHLPGCVSCQTIAAALREVDDGLAAMTPLEPHPALVQHTIRQAATAGAAGNQARDTNQNSVSGVPIVREARWWHPSQWFSRPLFAGAAVAALAAAVVLALPDSALEDGFSKSAEEPGGSVAYGPSTPTSSAAFGENKDRSVASSQPERDRAPAAPKPPSHAEDFGRYEYGKRVSDREQNKVAINGLPSSRRPSGSEGTAKPGDAGIADGTFALRAGEVVDESEGRKRPSSSETTRTGVETGRLAARKGSKKGKKGRVHGWNTAGGEESGQRLTQTDNGRFGDVADKLVADPTGQPLVPVVKAIETAPAKPMERRLDELSEKTVALKEEVFRSKSRLSALDGAVLAGNDPNDDSLVALGKISGETKGYMDLPGRDGQQGQAEGESDDRQYWHQNVEGLKNARDRGETQKEAANEAPRGGQPRFQAGSGTLVVRENTAENAVKDTFEFLDAKTVPTPDKAQQTRDGRNADGDGTGLDFGGSRVRGPKRTKADEDGDRWRVVETKKPAVATLTLESGDIEKSADETKTDVTARLRGRVDGKSGGDFGGRVTNKFEAKLEGKEEKEREKGEERREFEESDEEPEIVAEPEEVAQPITGGKRSNTLEFPSRIGIPKPKPEANQTPTEPPPAPPVNFAVNMPAAIAPAQEVSNLAFIPAQGWFENTYLPGDPALAWLEANLSKRMRVGGRDLRLQEAAQPYVQPLDAPQSAGLALRLAADRASLPAGQGPTRMTVQVALVGSQRHAAQRAMLNAAIVIDLRHVPTDADRDILWALAHEMGRVRRAGDRLALVVAGLDLTPRLMGREFRPAEALRVLTEALDERERLSGPLSGLDDAFAEAYRAVRGTQGAEDAPLGANTVVFATAGRVGRELAAVKQRAHTEALAGVSLTAIGVGVETDPAELGILALAGQGRRRLVSTTQEARETLGSELAAAGRVVARAVRLRIRLAEGVKLVEVLGSRRLDDIQADRVRAAEKAIDKRVARTLGIEADRKEDDDGILIHLPAFYAGDVHLVLLDVVASGPGLIAESTIQYKDLVRLRNGAGSDGLALRAGRPRPTAMTLSVLKNRIGYRVSKALGTAGRLAGKERWAAASQALNDGRARIAGLVQAHPVLAQDPELARDAGMLAEYETVLATAPQWRGNPAVADHIRRSLEVARRKKNTPAPLR